MTSDDPWHIKGVRPAARESAREAARRAGMSVGAWLDTVILDSALDEGIEPARPAEPQYDPYEDQAAARFETARGRPSTRERYRNEEADWHEGTRLRRRTPVDYALRQRPARGDSGDLPPGYDDLPHMVARRRRAAGDTCRPADDADEPVPAPAAAPDRYLPLVDQGFSEVRAASMA